MSEEIKIGTFLDLSGVLAPLCSPILHGMIAYFNMVNRSGGIKNRKIKLLYEDDKGDPTKSLTITKKFVEKEKVFAIVGSVGPGCLAVIDYCEKNAVPFIAPGIGSMAISYPPKKYIFGVQPNIYNEAQIIIKYAREKFHAEKFAVIRTTDMLGEEAEIGIKKGLELFGGELVCDIPIVSTQVEFEKEVKMLQETNCDIILLYALYKTASLAVKSIRLAGINAKIITTYANGSLEFLSVIGSSGEGLYIPAWINLAKLDDPGVERFLQTVYEEFPDEPNFLYCAFGWISAETFCHGLHLCEEPITVENYVKALETVKHWDGDLIKDLTYSPADRAGKYSMYFLKITNGMYSVESDWISIYND